MIYGPGGARRPGRRVVRALQWACPRLLRVTRRAAVGLGAMSLETGHCRRVRTARRWSRSSAGCRKFDRAAIEARPAPRGHTAAAARAADRDRRGRRVRRFPPRADRGDAARARRASLRPQERDVGTTRFRPRVSRKARAKRPSRCPLRAMLTSAACSSTNFTHNCDALRAR